MQSGEEAKHPTQVLYSQMEWALNTYLYNTGRITEKPPVDPPGCCPATKGRRILARTDSNG
jgi:hypothetical protein